MFQINVAPGAHPQLAALDLYDPWVNAENALEIWQSSGWNPWTTYTGGKYQQYLGLCGGIAAATPPANPSPVSLSSLSSLVSQKWFIPAALAVAVAIAIS